MTASITLAAGIYNLNPCEYLIADEGEQDDNTMLAPLDPQAYNEDQLNPRDDGKVPVEIALEIDRPTPGIIPLDGVEDTFILTVDLDDAKPEGIALITAFGPLSIENSYVLAPASQITRNPTPVNQYAYNWLSFELTTETVVTVSGSVITLGETVIDLSHIGSVFLETHSLDGEPVEWLQFPRERRDDVVSHYHISHNGDALNDVLNDMALSYDDSVIIVASFTPEHLERIEKIDTDHARAFALEMRNLVSRHNSNHIVLRPYFGK